MRVSFRWFIVATSLASLPACAHRRDDLKAEIASIQQRISGIEQTVDAQLPDISGNQQAIVTRVAYRPIIKWASDFSSGPPANRTIRFKQTSKQGSLYEQDKSCPVFGSREPAINIFIHEENSTEASLYLKDIAVEPQMDGLSLRMNPEARFKTQAAGAIKGCIGGWSPTVTIGVSGHATPAALFKLGFKQSGDTVRYSVDKISPNKIDLEMRLHFPFFRVGKTISMGKLGDRLFEGEVDMLLHRKGELAVPGQAPVPYVLRTVSPQLRTDTTGLTLSSDVDLQIGGPTSPGG